MPNSDYNLDQKDKEYFTFTIFNSEYQFLYPSGQDFIDIQKRAKDDIADESIVDIFGKFITPIGESQPFEEVFKKMRIPRILAFKDMVAKELGTET